MAERAKSTVKIELHGAGGGSVKVDGVDVAASVTRMTLDAAAGRGTRVRLDMLPGLLAATVDASAVTIDHVTARVLEVLGWTPPGAEYVLTWHPLTPGYTEPIHLPLNEHVEWMDGIGEFKLEFRPVVAEAPEVSGG